MLKLFSSLHLAQKIGSPGPAAGGPGSAPVLLVAGVSLGYGERTVLQDISLEVAPGQVVGLIGPNGSGKSTLLRGVGGLLPLRRGSISVAGHEIGRVKREALARLVAAVPQAAALPGAFTALEVVLMGRTPHLGLLRFEGPRDLALAVRALEWTRTQDLALRRVDELSGGEKQRLLMARALAQEPRLLLLDEPTAHLDIYHQVEALGLVHSLCAREGLACLAALHDLNLAVQFCHRLLLLHQGRIYAQGSPAEVITEANLRAVYGASVSVIPHPVNGLPLALVTPNPDGA